MNRPLFGTKVGPVGSTVGWVGSMGGRFGSMGGRFGSTVGQVGSMGGRFAGAAAIPDCLGWLTAKHGPVSFLARYRNENSNSHW